MESKDYYETEVVGVTHDELICVGPRTEQPYHLGNLLNALRVNPPWAPDLPLDAEGGCAPNYSK